MIYQVGSSAIGWAISESSLLLLDTARRPGSILLLSVALVGAPKE